MTKKNTDRSGYSSLERTDRSRTATQSFRDGGETVIIHGPYIDLASTIWPKPAQTLNMDANLFTIQPSSPQFPIYSAAARHSSLFFLATRHQTPDLSCLDAPLLAVHHIADAFRPPNRTVPHLVPDSVSGNLDRGTAGIPRFRLQ